MNNLIATIKHKVGLFHLMGALLLGGCIEGAGSLQASLVSSHKRFSRSPYREEVA